MTKSIDDHESLLADCVRLYEDLETAMGHIDLLMRDLTWTAGDIRNTIQNIERRMSDCETQLKHLVSSGY